MRGKNNWQRVGSTITRAKEFFKKGGVQPWYWKYRYRWNYYPKLQKVASFPTDLIIETCGVCNLRCTMCFREQMLGTKYSLMDLGLFKKIIDECKQQRIASVKLSWRGEVLLNKDFVPMVKYAKDAGIREVSALSNATKLTPEISKGLIESGLDYFIFSADGATKETYEKIRVGADYDEVVSNIKNFMVVRGSRKKPQTRIQLTEITENRKEVQEFVNQWKGVVDEVAISGFIDYSYLDESKPYERQEELKAAKGRLPCPSLWRRLAIMADGTATVCCIDVKGKLAIGNVREKSIKELWEGARLNQLREIHKNKQLDSIEACRKCNWPPTYEF